MKTKIVGLVFAVLLLALGAYWTATGLGWIGDASEESSLATIGPLVAGLGVALVIVTFQKRH